MTGWHEGPLLAFDTETSGVDVENDRIVTGSIVKIRPGQGPAVEQWLADPGIEIPEVATAVHGITTEHARAHGKPPAEVLDVLAADLAMAMHRGVPIVGMNLAYDFTLLDRECRRHGVPTVTERRDGDLFGPVIDVRVLDKQVDPYRRGGRKLVDLCATYGVRIDGAHDASFDAIASARVAWAIAKRYPEVGTAPLRELHELQIGWAFGQAKSLADYFRRKGKDASDVDGSWPLRPANQQQGIGV